MSSKNKYVSVGQLHYRSDLDDKKTPARTYKPGDSINEDLSKNEIDRLLKKGAIKESSLAKKEQAARDEAAQLAQQAQDAAEEAASAATTAATPAETEKPADVEAARGDAARSRRK